MNHFHPLLCRFRRPLGYPFNIVVCCVLHESLQLVGGSIYLWSTAPLPSSFVLGTPWYAVRRPAAHGTDRAVRGGLQVTFYTSAVTLSVLGNVKSVLVIIVSLGIFRNTISPLTVVGTFITLCSAGFYSQGKLRQSNAKFHLGPSFLRSSRDV